MCEIRSMNRLHMVQLSLWMHRKHIRHGLALALLHLFTSGCDKLVSPSYKGESRLSLRVSVVKSLNNSVADVVPALAYVDDDRVAFRAVEYRDTLTAEFQVDVYDAPAAERMRPLDALRTPDVRVAREYIGAVLPPRIAQPIALSEREVQIYPDCWNGSCDLLPGAMTAPCADDDKACLARQRQCPNAMCQVVASGATLPEGIEDVIGFSNDFVVLYAERAIAAGSWAALTLGAPDGLAPGYHLIQNVEPSAEASRDADQCMEEAELAALERFNDAHQTMYTGLQVSCLDGTRSADTCEGVDYPEGAARRELGSALVEEELARGCLELAPRLQLVQQPAKPIVVRINGKGPEWLPSVVPARIPLEAVDCPRETDPATGEPMRAEVVPRLIRYAGGLCPEGTLFFSDSTGAFGVTGFLSTFTGSQSCELNFSLTVPAGYRFRRPRFLFQAETTSESESARPTFVTMTYAMASDPMSSHHVVYPSLEGDVASLADTPEISVPQCSDACESQQLDLTVNIDIDAPETTYTSIFDLSCSHEVGVEWTTCSRDFPER